MGQDWYEGCTRDVKWRVNHLYYIQDKSGRVMRFKMNWAQEELFNGLWTRNAVLKGRQLGISTLVEILGLDACLFHENFEMGIIDKTLADAKQKLRRMRQAYEWMAEAPAEAGDYVEDEEDRENIAKYAAAIARGSTDPTARSAKFTTESASFRNGSQVKIGISLRGGTLHLLHVSELASVAHNFPRRAEEIITGGINTVGKDSVIISESTHEGGKYGEHYRLIRQAMENTGRKRDRTDFAFFFFPWWRQGEYALPESTADTSELAEYWTEVAEKGIELTDAQKRWYFSLWRTMGAAMRREYPSTAEEALANQFSGAIFGEQIERLRAAGRIGCEFEADRMHPIYASWDLGMRDYTAVWLIQPGGDGRFYLLDYFCGSRQGLDFYFERMRAWEREYGLITRHFLPFDAEAATSRVDTVTAARYFAAAQMPYAVVPRAREKWGGIYAARDLLPYCVFHRRCSTPIITEGTEYMSGVDALEGYKTGGLTANGQERSEPLHDACSHGADAFRYFAQAVAKGMVGREDVRRREAGDVRMSERRRELEAAGAVRGVPAFWNDRNFDGRRKAEVYTGPKWWSQ